MGPDQVGRQIEETQYQLAALGDTIARARLGLVQELVEVFSVVEVCARFAWLMWFEYVFADACCRSAVGRRWAGRRARRASGR